MNYNFTHHLFNVACSGKKILIIALLYFETYKWLVAISWYLKKSKRTIWLGNFVVEWVKHNKYIFDELCDTLAWVDNVYINGKKAICEDKGGRLSGESPIPHRKNDLISQCCPSLSLVILPSSIAGEYLYNPALVNIRPTV